MDPNEHCTLPPAGTYLAACALYTRIFGPCPVGDGYTDGLSSSVAGTLAAIANLN